MTTEETELTFVRCSNCRSLIPAIATRCRMCGAQFEKKAEASEAQSPQDQQNQNRQSRVRQRTISASVDEVEQMKRDAFSEGEGHEATAFRLAGHSPRSEFVAPSEAESIPNYSPPPVSANETPAHPHEDEDEFDEVSATHHSQDRESFRFVDRISEQDDDWNEDGDPLTEDFAPSEEEEEEDELHEELMPEETIGSLPTRAEGRRKRRRRRRKRSHGPLPHERREDESPPEPAQHAQPRYERTEVPRYQPPVAEVKEVTRGEMNMTRSEAIRGEMPRMAPEGRLVGWLVAFGEDAQGRSVELRAGRYFLGRQKLRSNDFIIPHESISTPHCMVLAGGGDSLVIQDLMSESGTQLRRAGETAYSYITNSVSVQHGDWIRFGQYEVLVCLLPKNRAS